MSVVKNGCQNTRDNIKNILKNIFEIDIAGKEKRNTLR